MKKPNQEKYVYEISTNPIKESDYVISPIVDDEQEGFALGFTNEMTIITGMSPSVEETIEKIKNSSLVYIIGELDVTSFFELGLAISLGKPVYYVTQKEYSNYDFKLPYELDDLIPIEYHEFIEVVNKIFV